MPDETDPAITLDGKLDALQISITNAVARAQQLHGEAGVMTASKWLDTMKTLADRSFVPETWPL